MKKRLDIGCKKAYNVSMSNFSKIKQRRDMTNYFRRKLL